MLTIIVPELECWDEEKEEFYYEPEVKINLEHSLKAISKWEEHYCKPFLTDERKSEEELCYYIQCMTLNEVEDRVYKRLSQKDYIAIQEYLTKRATATTFSSNKKNEKKDNSYMTSEQIYSYMANYRIPFSCDEWHIERLLTLIRACGVLNEDHSTKKNLTSTELSDRARRNAEYKKAHGIPN